MEFEEKKVAPKGFFARIKARLDQPMFNIKGGKLSFIQKIGIGKERDYFIDNLSLLLSAGMDIIQALDAIQDELKTDQMIQVVSFIKNEINDGKPMWSTLEQTNILPANIIALVRVGEESGRLSENLQILAVQQEKARIFKAKVRSGMMYPVFLLIFTVVIGISIAWFMLPNLVNVFTQLNLELPLITRIILGIGLFLKAYGSVAVPSFFLVFGVSLYFIFLYEKTKFIGQTLLLHTPVVKRLITESEIARFGFILGTLLDAGLNITDAIESLEKSTTIFIYKNFYIKLNEDIRIGKSFQESFAEYKTSSKLIPRPIQQMVITSEQSSNLSSSLLKIGKRYEDKIENTAKNLSVLLEPLLLIIIWGGVVSLALAIIIPVYGLIGSVNDVSKKPAKKPEPVKESSLLINSPIALKMKKV